MRAGTKSTSPSLTAARRPRRWARGFSLLELTLVLAIIGILMAVATISIIGKGEAAKVRATQATIRVVKNALEEYNLNNNSFPPNLRTLITVKSLANQKLQDGWGKDIYYDPKGRSKEQPYILGSSGPDGTMGSEDDINVWTMDAPASAN